jgi:hypothetical protein
MNEPLKSGTVISQFMCCLDVCFWIKALEEYVPLLHLYWLSSNFKAVTWAITHYMVDDSVALIQNE